MTHFFDGMTGALAGIFGDEVQYVPRVGLVRNVQGVFRESPIEVTGVDGQDVLIDAPTWRVERHLVPEVARDDIIQVPDGRLFRITTTHSGGSPAVDAFVICELHRVD